jgi:hypothetical protein
MTYLYDHGREIDFQVAREKLEELIATSRTTNSQVAESPAG